LTLIFAVSVLGTLLSLLVLAALSDQLGRRPAQRRSTTQEVDRALCVSLPCRLHRELFQVSCHDKAGSLCPGQLERLGQAWAGVQAAKDGLTLLRTTP